MSVVQVRKGRRGACLGLELALALNTLLTLGLRACPMPGSASRLNLWRHPLPSDVADAVPGDSRVSFSTAAGKAVKKSDILHESGLSVAFFGGFMTSGSNSFHMLLRTLFISALSVACFSFTAAAPAAEFSFTVLEIKDIQRGAGLAIVMRTPSGKTWLYDTGTAHPEKLSSDGWLANFNAGRDLIAPLLKKEGVSSIDGVFMSHAHYDHFGGLLWLKDNFKIKLLIDCGYTFHSDAEADYVGTNKGELDHYSQVREEFRARGAYLSATAGETLKLDPDLKIEVIAPPKTYFKDPMITTRPKNDTPSHFLVNANSLALRIQFGEIVFLLPGDIQTEDIETSLMPFVDKAKMKCHILVAPGHGIHPIPQAFGEATRPEVSIASVFPRYARGIRSTKDLQALGTRTYVTGLNGTVQVVTDGKTYRVSAERDDGAGKGDGGDAKP